MMTEETAQSTTPIFEKPHVTNVDDGAEEGEKKTQKNASKWTVKGEEPKSWPLGDTVLDIHERDPNMINQYAKTLFGDIFAEPEPTTFSFDAIWRLSFTVFTGTKLWCYRITALLFALPAAVCWGFYFACMSVLTVWCCVPYVRAWDICMHCFKQLCVTTLDAFVGPFFAAVGKIFGGIGINVTYNAHKS